MDVLALLDLALPPTISSEQCLEAVAKCCMALQAVQQRSANLAYNCVCSAKAQQRYREIQRTVARARKQCEHEVAWLSSAAWAHCAAASVLPQDSKAKFASEQWGSTVTQQAPRAWKGAHLQFTLCH